MECKASWDQYFSLHSLRFNRYIVECKDTFGAAGTDAKTGFNRYIVECKAIFPATAATCTDDLIDTLWNVKKGDRGEDDIFHADLIDTLWNVKPDLHRKEQENIWI